MGDKHLQTVLNVVIIHASISVVINIMSSLLAHIKSTSVICVNFLMSHIYNPVSKIYPQESLSLITYVSFGRCQNCEYLSGSKFANNVIDKIMPTFLSARRELQCAKTFLSYPGSTSCLQLSENKQSQK